MKTQAELQDELEALLGSKNVYYQPPSSIKMSYPAIRYSKKDINPKFANDQPYLKRTCYELIVIDQIPDNPVIEKLLELSYCSYDRGYKMDNLNHDILNLYV